MEQTDHRYTGSMWSKWWRTFTFAIDENDKVHIGFLEEFKNLESISNDRQNSYLEFGRISDELD